MSSSQQSHRGVVENMNSPIVSGELQGVLTNANADAATESVDMPPTMPTSAIGAVSVSEAQHGNAEQVQGAMLPRVSSSVTSSPARSTATRKRGATQSPSPTRERSQESPPRRQAQASPIRSIDEAAPMPRHSRPQPPWVPMTNVSPPRAQDGLAALVRRMEHLQNLVEQKLSKMDQAAK